MAASARDWWKHAVVYQVYPRSFYDSDGDGLGDIRGVAARVGYLAQLGVDAIWLSPFYPSDLADGGYDVIDYRDVDPRLGTLDDFDALVAAAHAAGIKVMVDIVPNHTSNKHAWFRQALAEGPGSPLRDRYIFRPGRGDAGELPPNDWQSTFGGPAWERVADGEWYLHLFAKEQPDLNWKNADVRADFERTLRFWSDRGVDGFRVDVAHGLAKDLDSAALDELGRTPIAGLAGPGVESPVWDRPEVHEIYRAWRRVFNEYEPPRFAVAEAWVCPEHQHLYASPEELGQVFNFEFAKADWFAADFRRAIEEGLASAGESGSTTTWVMSNHDVPRNATRYGLPQVKTAGHHQLVTDWILRDGATYFEDRALGTRRARAAALMELSLPGSVYIYQGEELGLFEVANIPWDRLEDPKAANTSGAASDKGRDGCRVPLPWTASDAPAPAAWDERFGDGATGSFGFSAPRADGSRTAPHLPQPLWFAEHAVDIEAEDAGSMLALYRRALALRHELLGREDEGPAAGCPSHGELAGGRGAASGPSRESAFQWMDPSVLGREPEQVIAYERRTTDGRRLMSITNFGAAPVPLPVGTLVLSSTELADCSIPRDAAAWILAED